MHDSWITTTLGDCVELTTGPAFQSARFTNKPLGGIRLARGDNVKEGMLEWGDKSRFWPEMSSSLSQYLLSEGDLLVGMDGSKVGRNWTCVSASDLPCLLVQRVARLRAKNQLDQRYLRYLVGNAMFRSYIEAVKTGTSIPHISGNQIKSFPIKLPPLRDQYAIVNILGALDDKIELNRKMSATLEAIARALFKSWFVDFDPVRAKAEGREPELSAEIAELFPDSFQYLRGVELPSTWTLEPVGELADVVGGSTPSTSVSSYWGGSYGWVTPKDLADLATPVLLSTSRTISEDGLSKISSGLLAAGTVLLSSRAPIGYLAVTEIPVAINQGFIAMKAREGISNLFLLRWAESSLEAILARANGSTFLEISKTNFRPIPVVVPVARVMQAFDATVRPLRERLVMCEQEARTLAALREALLPKLISGELRVSDAERFLAASA